MLKNIYTLVIVLFFAGSHVAQASEKTVYKKYNKDGVVEFSDLPGKKSKPVHVPQMNTYKQKPFPKAAKQTTKQKPATGYSQFNISSPANNSTIRANDGRVTITLDIKPDLKTEDIIKIVLNGDEKSAVTSKSSSISFPNLFRGTHKVQAYIIGQDGSILAQSPPVVFYLLRAYVKPKVTP